ncbi:hypothetical protein ACQCSU_14645 [Pseudarthrobacter sp. O4]|uniref:hypothetical protein n=1 Tax=Pseudarthrobacter sp. O4 TaxID=3418417 RepID=UPI003CEAA128
MANVARADEWSKLLFNNIYVLRVSAAISNGDVETDSGTLQRELSLGQTAVYRVMRTLERVNLLERMERSSRTQPLKYRRVSHPFWDAALELLSTAEGA